MFRKALLAGCAAAALPASVFAKSGPDCHPEYIAKVSRETGETIYYGQTRAAAGLDKRKLWQLPVSAEVTYCGRRKLVNGRVWHFVSFEMQDEPWRHDAWISSNILTADTPRDDEPPKPVIVEKPVYVPVPQAASPPPMQENRSVAPPSAPNNYYSSGPEAFDPKSCLTVVELTQPFDVYKGASFESDKLTSLNINDKVCVVEFGEWSKIHWRRDGSFDGYVHALQIKATTKPF